MTATKLTGFNPETDYPDQPHWFDALGSCRCGKPATGKLMGPRNESYGQSCGSCADKRLKRAKQERDAVAEYEAGRAALEGR